MKKNYLLWALAAMMLLCGEMARAQYVCDTLTLPYTEHFNVQNGLPPCWTMVESDTVGNDVYPKVMNDGYVYYLVMYNVDDDSLQWVALPAMPLDVQAVKLTIDWRISGYVALEVGLMSDVNDTSTFVLAAPPIVEGGNHSIWIDVAGMPGGHLALRTRATQLGWSWGMLLSLSVEQAASCPQPAGLRLASVDSTSALVQWDEAVLDGWLVKVGNEPAYTTQVNTLDMSDLQPNTNYHVELRALCSGGDTTEPSVLDFTTLCGVTTLPLNEDFEAYQEGRMPNCWRTGSRNVTIGRDQFAEENKYVIISGTTDSSYSMLVSPYVFTNGDRMHVGFDMRSSYDGRLEAGLLVDDADGERFVHILTVETENFDITSSNEWRRRDFYTDTVASVGFDVPMRLAFRWLSNVAMRTVQLDNITAEPVGDCHAPTSPHIDTVYGTTVVLSWEDYSLVQYPYEVMMYRTDDSAATREVYYTEETSLLVNGLESMQVYAFSLRSLCPDDSVRWVDFGMVATECGNIVPPYCQNFDYMGGSFECWEGDQQWYVSGQRLRISQNAVSVPVSVSTPIIDAPADELYVSFDYSFSCGSADVLEVGFTVVENGDTAFVRLATLPPASVLTHADFYTDTVTIDSLVRLTFRLSHVTNYSSASVAIDNLCILRSNGCHHPTAVVVDEVGADYATVHITDTNYVGNYHLVLEHGGESESLTMSDTVGSLLMLEPGSVYTLTASALCGMGVESFALAGTTFVTGCAPITELELPYEQRFGDLTLGPDVQVPCWHLPSVPAAMLGQLNGDTLLSLTAGSQSVYAVLPEMESLEELYIEFDFMKSSVGGTVEVGIMTFPYEAVTFSPVAIVDDEQTNRWRHFQISLDDYVGNGHFLAFRVTDATVELDNVKVDRVPDCSHRIDSLTLSNVWSYCADLSWVTDLGRNRGGEYRIHVADGQGNPLGTYYANGSPYTLCNLEEMSEYSVWVDLYCGMDVQAVSDTLHFTTLCDNIQGLEVSHATLGVTLNTLSTHPFDATTRYSATQQLFTVYDFAYLSSDIAGVEVNYYGYFSSVDIKSCTIYLNHTDLDSITDWQPLGEVVYTGALHLEQGWNLIYFNHPVHHPADSNLTLTFVTETDEANSNHLFLGYRRGPGSSVRFNSASAPFDSTSIGYASSYRSNVRFFICPGETVECLMPRVTSLTSTDNSITMTYSGGGACEVQITSNHYWTTAVEGIPVDGGSYTFQGLEPNTHYIVGVRRPCGGDYSAWHVDHISTSIPDCPRPAAPTVSDVDSRHATIAFDPVGASRWQVHFFNYLIDTTFTTADLSVSFEGLMPTVTYHACYRLLCDYNNRSLWSDTLTFSTSHCRDIADARVVPASPSAVSVSWNGGDTVGAVEPERYSVMYGLHGFMRGEAIDTILTVDQSVTVEGLDMPANSYDFFVMAHCPDGTATVWTFAGTYPEPQSSSVPTAYGIGSPLLHPNPTTGIVTVDLPQPAMVVVLDINGRTVCASNALAANHHLDLSTLPQGTYFVRTTSASGTAVAKLLKL